MSESSPLVWLRTDEHDDWMCWCDTCGWVTQLEMIDKFQDATLDRNCLGCVICGCSRHADEFGDRICWCDTCHDVTVQEMQNAFHSLNLSDCAQLRKEDIENQNAS